MSVDKAEKKKGKRYTSSLATRETLISTALRLFETKGLQAVKIDDVVDAAGVAKGTFYVHFPERAAFLIHIHREFHDRLKKHIVDGTLHLPHGKERLQSGLVIYLDACLREKGVKAFLFEARVEPALVDEVIRRNADFTKVVTLDLEAMNWENSQSAARLVVSMGAEAALAELQAGKKLPSIRRALFDFLER